MHSVAPVTGSGVDPPSTLEEETQDMSTRLTVDQIIDALEGGGEVPECWSDLFEDFSPTSDDGTNDDLLVQCARFLREAFPEQKTWGWQDFDILLAKRLVGSYASKEEAGFILANDHLEAGSITQDEYNTLLLDGMDRYISPERGIHALAVDSPDEGVLIFTGIRSISDITRN
jgi:hypothetical protein